MAITATGCKKEFDVNKYANQRADDLPNLLLYAGLDETATNNAINYLDLPRWMGYWARNGSFPPDEQTETYDIKNSYTDSEWIRIYQNLAAYDLLENTGRNLSLPFYIGAAKVMKAYCFSTLVDLYNDVPYKEAFGENTKDHPAYDNGQDIYNDLVAQLDSAIIYFENARVYYQNHPVGVALTDDQYDIMFGSARTKASSYNQRLTLWEKLTNTLELKLLLHQSQIPAQQNFIQKKINTIITSGERKAAGFIGAGESAVVNPGYNASSGKQNPFYNLFINTDGSFTRNSLYYCANTYAFDFYSSGNDSRLGYLYGTSITIMFLPCGICGDTAYFFPWTVVDDSITLYNFTNGPVIAVYKGDTLHPEDFGSNYDGDPNALSSIFAFDIVGGLFKGSAQDQFIFSDFESLFLQAEAVQRGYIVGSAQNLYEAAITQNYLYVFGQNVVYLAKSYFTQGIPDIDWSASPNKLEAILTQKWAAMNGINWVEAYADYRRTGYPASNILGISHAPTHAQPMIPIRFLYPQVELNKNAAHVPQLGANAQFTAKVFWDK
jgi:hypothetical protein